MKQKEDIFEINGKTYKLGYDFTGDGEPGSECANCPLQDVCHDADGLICQTVAGEDASTHKRFFEVEAPEPKTLTEDDVYEYYQERSVKAGERADQLAWMFIVMMTGGLISGHAFQTFSICAMLAAIYMLLSVVQAVWQTFTSWLFKNIIHRTGETPEDYPSWVGGGAWFFFWAKMITIASAVIYFAKAILF
jgi:hypothetical protein